jgi:hypothetical protein
LSDAQSKAPAAARYRGFAFFIFELFAWFCSCVTGQLIAGSIGNAIVLVGEEGLVH